MDTLDNLDVTFGSLTPGRVTSSARQISRSTPAGASTSKCSDTDAGDSVERPPPKLRVLQCDTPQPEHQSTSSTTALATQQGETASSDNERRSYSNSLSTQAISAQSTSPSSQDAYSPASRPMEGMSLAELKEKRKSLQIVPVASLEESRRATIVKLPPSRQRAELGPNATPSGSRAHVGPPPPRRRSTTRRLYHGVENPPQRPLKRVRSVSPPSDPVLDSTPHSLHGLPSPSKRPRTSVSNTNEAFQLENRADTEKKRADKEKKRADAEKKRADKAERETKHLKEELRKLAGIAAGMAQAGERMRQSLVRETG